MMKKVYIEPMITIEAFQVEDIITASGTGEVDTSGSVTASVASDGAGITDVTYASFFSAQS